MLTTILFVGIQLLMLLSDFTILDYHCILLIHNKHLYLSLVVRIEDHYYGYI